jgi:hypothetical protein
VKVVAVPMAASGGVVLGGALVELPGLEDVGELRFVFGESDDDVQRSVLGEPDFEEVVVLDIHDLEMVWLIAGAARYSAAIERHSSCEYGDAETSNL